MSNPDLTAWLDRVIDTTKSGGIQWKTVNPTTYTWESRTPASSGRVALQRIEQMEPARQIQPGVVRAAQKRTVYLMQVFDISKAPLPGPQTAVISLNGGEDAEINAKLESLFSLASTIVPRESIDFLRSLLPQ